MAIETALKSRLNSLLVGLEYSAGRVHINTVPTAQSRPYIFFQRTGREQDVLPGGTADDVIDDTFSVEVVGVTPEEALDISDEVRTLHGWYGTLGDRIVLAFYVDDQSEDYVPRSGDGDDGGHIASLVVRITHRPSA